MKIFNNNTELVFLDTNSYLKVVAILKSIFKTLV